MLFEEITTAAERAVGFLPLAELLRRCAERRFSSFERGTIQPPGCTGRGECEASVYFRGALYELWYEVSTEERFEQRDPAADPHRRIYFSTGNSPDEANIIAADEEHELGGQVPLTRQALLLSLSVNFGLPFYALMAEAVDIIAVTRSLPEDESSWQAKGWRAPTEEEARNFRWMC